MRRVLQNIVSSSRVLNSMMAQINQFLFRLTRISMMTWSMKTYREVAEEEKIIINCHFRLLTIQIVAKCFNSKVFKVKPSIHRWIKLFKWINNQDTIHHNNTPPIKSKLQKFLSLSSYWTIIKQLHRLVIRIKNHSQKF